jgi:hypothetical protein
MGPDDVQTYLQHRRDEADHLARSYRGEQASRLTPEPSEAKFQEGRVHAYDDALAALAAGGNPYA